MYCLEFRSWSYIFPKKKGEGGGGYITVVAQVIDSKKRIYRCLLHSNMLYLFLYTIMVHFIRGFGITILENNKKFLIVKQIPKQIDGISSKSDIGTWLACGLLSSPT
jgi:hypothetical protein